MKKTSKKSDFHEGLWGLAFKSGKLYEFTDTHVLVMKGWPDPRAWFKRRSHAWKPTRQWADALFSQPAFLEQGPIPEKPARPFVLPNGQLILPGVTVHEERRARREYSDFVARTSFVDLIPRDILNELRRYSSRRWHVLNILARCSGAMDLSRSNPALLFALASNWAFHKPRVSKPMRAARSLVWKKQRVVLDWLGFPGTEPVRRLFSKIGPRDLDVEALLYLRRALQTPACLSLLSHLPRLNRASVMLAADRRIMEHVSPRLLEDVVEAEGKGVAAEDEAEGKKNVYRLMVDTVRMARIVDWEKCPRVFCSLKRVQTVHDELSPRMDAERMKKRYGMPDRFAAPPFAGNEHVIPLTTPEELCTEGYLQKNCVASHMFSVARGWEYVYRVEQPVRGTLSVAFRRGSWEADEFLKACNQPVDAGTRRQVFSALFRTRRAGIEEGAK